MDSPELPIVVDTDTGKHHNSPMDTRLARRTALMPEDEPPVETFLALLRAHEGLSTEAAKFFQQYGITMQQYNVLRVLYVRSGENGLRCSDISERLINREPDMTRLLDRLERAELISRSRCTEDRRVVWIRLTERGYDLVESLHEPLLGFYRRRFTHLTPEELSTLRRLLDKARAATPERGGE
jgi:DNA-binding MarR family transcriptional regulator